VSNTETLSPAPPGSCRRCGAPLGAFRFCLNCGATVPVDGRADGPPDGPSAGPPAGRPAGRPAGPPDGPGAEEQDAPAPSSGLRRALRGIARWRTPIVVFPLLAGVAIAAGTGAQMLTAKIPTDTRAEITCWDGGAARAAEDCAPPSGVAGLRWVFPTFHPQRDDCVDVLVEHPEYPRPAMYACELKVGRRWVAVTYMQLADVDAGRRYFEKAFPGSVREKVRGAGGTPYRYVWRKRTDDAFVLASMYVDYPFAVTVSASAAEDRDRGLRKLVFRPPDRMRVAPEPSREP
jgi:hypothetical protein